MSDIVVIGNGWAALGAVGMLSQQGHSVRWVTGTGSRVLAPLPMLEAGSDSSLDLGVSFWKELAEKFGIDAGEVQTGSYLREFRNKAFRETAWTKGPSLEDRRQIREEYLWKAERSLAPLYDARFSLTLGDIENQLREKLMADEKISHIEGVPVTGFKVENGKVTGVVLGSGEEIACDQVIYADRWSVLGKMEGIPKALPFIRKRDPMGAIQASFTHAQPLGVAMMEGFYAPLHKESGEEFERHVFGYFSTDGMKSFWTILMSGDEVEDNHEIAKKLRRMKNALEKMFSGNEGLGLSAEKPDFLASIVGEQVRFEESVLFAEGDVPAAPITVSKLDGLSILTDGYGPSSAMHQLAVFFGAVPKALTQAEGAGAEPAPEVSA